MSAARRLPRELARVSDLSNVGIYYRQDPHILNRGMALIIGPPDSIYANCLLFFKFEFPNDYPFAPPKVEFLTNDGDTRFHPNLYIDGKVCLSILGTWAGPGWTPVMNIRLVLDSIRSLMGAFPVQNEPSYETIKPDNIISIEYNQYLIYNTYKVAIIDVLNNKFASVSEFFKNEIGNEIIKNHKKLSDNLLSYNHIYGNTEIEKRIYFMKKTKLDFSILVDLFSKINI